MRKLLLLLAVVAIVGCQQPIGPSESPSPGILVAVGGGGMISRSTDAGRTWQVSMGTQVKILDYSAYNMKVNQLQVNGEINQGLIAQVQASSNAIAQLNSVGFLGDAYARGTLYQQLGQQWSGLIANPFGANTIYTVCYGNGVFVAAGAAGTLATSPTFGATWSALINCNFGANNVRSCAYGNNTFVIVGNGGSVGVSTTYGASWSAVINPAIFAGINIESVAFGNGVFVAVTTSGVIGYSLDNGNTWTLATSNPFGANIINSVVFGNGVFVAVGANGAGAGIARSLDNGKTWGGAFIANSFTGGNCEAVSFGNGVFVVGATSNQISRSVDNGATWSALIANPFSVGPFFPYGISYNFGIFQFGSSNAQTARSYDNGKTWGLSSNPFGANGIQCIASSLQVAGTGFTSTGTGNLVAVGAAGSIATAGWNAAYSLVQPVAAEPSLGTMHKHVFQFVNAGGPIGPPATINYAMATLTSIPVQATAIAVFGSWTGAGANEFVFLEDSAGTIYSVGFNNVAAQLGSLSGVVILNGDYTVRLVFGGVGNITAINFWMTAYWA